ncbi:transcription initiation factor TFIID subunit 15-like [Mangifera indica]|uniref:transcription initiation factor TFIID subunit 15-like n=1 Tax=Mangifera indica TaxID=29780 RepID=UPI001CFA4BC7|nr:transcription initiation factor TFIID subunit 15-like [Mangifera indica]
MYLFLNRGGRGGGYKELDEEELEETKRRRRKAEEDDGELYDEFGNVKKKFRAKTQQAEAGQVLPGAGRAGWDVEELDMGEREAEIGEGIGMIGKAARIGIMMIKRGTEIRVERGI